MRARARTCVVATVRLRSRKGSPFDMSNLRQAYLASRRGVTLLAFLGCAWSALDADRAAAQGAIIRPFARRVTFNMPGDFLIIGNVNSVCSTTRGGSNITQRCTQGRNPNPGVTSDFNNDNVFMDYFIDPSIAGMSAGGSAVFNASTATLTLPANATVEFAGLYWAGAYQAGASTGSGSNNIPAGSAAPTPNRRNTVYIKTPHSGSLLQVVATQFDEPSFDQAPDIYQGFRDVTQIVKDGGSGTYAIANMQVGTGRQKTGGWSLVVVFQSPTEPERNLTV